LRIEIQRGTASPGDMAATTGGDGSLGNIRTHGGELFNPQSE
jgi:hypothetical protein